MNGTTFQAPCQYRALRGVANCDTEGDSQDSRNHQRNDTDTNHYRISETLAENSIVECSEIGKMDIPSGVGHCPRRAIASIRDAIKTLVRDLMNPTYKTSIVDPSMTREFDSKWAQESTRRSGKWVVCVRQANQLTPTYEPSVADPTMTRDLVHIIPLRREVSYIQLQSQNYSGTEVVIRLTSMMGYAPQPDESAQHHGAPVAMSSPRRMVSSYGTVVFSVLPVVEVLKVGWVVGLAGNALRKIPIRTSSPEN